ncbi:two-component system response regulator OmpR [Vibrio cholerae]|uniref:osmolarity response regulator transcription factor OmpR n=1 Tax=Vibrio cholerae TaxID=666 RepID=UPI0020875726|nr:two-component system response regulator OmpR [Vibrio cholerae]MDV2404798.1 two-component system response regulator OmpR [Vibrio cholerae]WOQ87522.1 two-component system response regulator OmpR [Vibrio cholerae]BER95821.1 two-component system response regulator OmpR [Vibrio cholerae]GHX08833.1 osmolarity response regulator [Vibrio cholerae]GIB04809.1 osmolarity response regulator [Vibrio cholerae]
MSELASQYLFRYKDIKINNSLRAVSGNDVTFYSPEESGIEQQLGGIMVENHKVLVVDDDARLRALLERYLSEQGFQVRSVANGEQMDRLLTRENFHLMVLDLMLPGEDGLSICRRLRNSNNMIPILMLTAKGDEIDRIVGLEVGADDYLPKPFNPRELLARIKAVLRRQVIEAPGAPSAEETIIEFGEFRLNLGTREMFRGEEAMPLTSGEFAVLKALVTNAREPLSRDKLMNMARGREYSAMERSIDVQISRLRRMLEVDPSKPRYIQTVWGLGYVFVPDGKAAN